MDGRRVCEPCPEFSGYLDLVRSRLGLGWLPILSTSAPGMRDVCCQRNLSAVTWRRRQTGMRYIPRVSDADRWPDLHLSTSVVRFSWASFQLSAWRSSSLFPRALFSTSQEVGWEERLRNDLFCVEWDVKPQLKVIIKVSARTRMRRKRYVFLEKSWKKCA